jgi:hypothetical protein
MKTGSERGQRHQQHQGASREAGSRKTKNSGRERFLQAKLDSMSDLLSAAVAGLRKPTVHDKVYKDECMFSFDRPESEGGLYLNLRTFQARCRVPCGGGGRRCSRATRRIVR